MANYPMSWKMDVGVNHVPAYQVSGRPYVSGNINAMNASGAMVQFPYVTRWIYVVNHDPTENCRVGFSRLGVNGEAPKPADRTGTGAPAAADGNSNFWFLVHTSSQSPLLELKVSEIWLSGSHNVDIVAGLTTVLPARITSGSTANPNDGAYPSWSGSAGVG